MKRLTSDTVSENGYCDAGFIIFLMISKYRIRTTILRWLKKKLPKNFVSLKENIYINKQQIKHLDTIIVINWGGVLSSV